MTTFCISCPAELPEEHEAAVKHFMERNIEVNFINGIHAETFGILAWRPYRKDNPKAGFVIKMAAVGLALTHHMIWQICQYHHDDMWMVLEADCEFCENWKERLDQALIDAPEDWQIILVGSCNCSDKPQTHIKGDVFKVEYPFCTHAYIFRESALEELLKIRDSATNIDISLADRVYPVLKTYTILPRICGQRTQALMP